MGMMDAQQPQAQMQDSVKGYNGVVQVEGKPIQVTNGGAEVGGAKYFVSEGGELVVDGNHQPIGYVENGVFKPMDQQQADKLKQMGVLQ